MRAFLHVQENRFVQKKKVLGNLDFTEAGARIPGPGSPPDRCRRGSPPFGTAPAAPCLWLDAVFPFRFSVFRDALTGMRARTARPGDPVRKT